jgi:hypothetical protein
MNIKKDLPIYVLSGAIVLSTLIYTTQSKSTDKGESTLSTNSLPGTAYGLQDNLLQVSGLQSQVQQLTSQLRLCQSGKQLLELQQLQNQMNESRNRK